MQACRTNFESLLSIPHARFGNGLTIVLPAPAPIPCTGQRQISGSAAATLRGDSRAQTKTV